MDVLVFASAVSIDLPGPIPENMTHGASPTRTAQRLNRTAFEPHSEYQPRLLA